MGFFSFVMQASVGVYEHELAKAEWFKSWWLGEDRQALSMIKAGLASGGAAARQKPSLTRPAATTGILTPWLARLWLSVRVHPASASARTTQAHTGCLWRGNDYYSRR